MQLIKFNNMAANAENGGGSNGKQYEKIPTKKKLVRINFFLCMDGTGGIIYLEILQNF